MSSSCVDRRSQTYLNKQQLSDGPTINTDGSYTLDQIDVFTKELADNIVAESDNNPISLMVNKFGDDFAKSVTYINGPFRNYNTTDYPSLDNRFSRGNVTDLEMADFMTAFNYAPNGVINQTPDVLLSNLEKYYEGDIFESILGGFCNSMNNLFNQIDSFYDLIGEVDGIIKDAAAAYAKFTALLDKYEGQNKLELIQQAIVKALMKEIQEKIIDSVVKIYQKIMEAIENFDIVDQIGDLVVGIDKTHTKNIMTRKERMCDELTEEAQEKMKSKLKGFMDYAFGLFEYMDLQTMQFLVARFCALASNVEALVNEIKNPLDDYGNRYQRVIKRLQAIGNQNTSTAIRNGAIRFSPEQRQNDLNTLYGIWEGESVTLKDHEKIDVEPITAQDYKDLPKCMAVKNGSEIFKLEGKVFEEKENEKDSERIGIAAYTHIDLDVKVYLKRLQAIYGNTMVITNGWVSPEYNQKTLKMRPDNSHLSGLVIDIKMDAAFKANPESVDTTEDWPDTFARNAKKSGFKNVVIYDTHIHLDIRDIPR